MEGLLCDRMLVYTHYILCLLIVIYDSIVDLLVLFYAHFDLSVMSVVVMILKVTLYRPNDL